MNIYKSPLAATGNYSRSQRVPIDHITVHTKTEIIPKGSMADITSKPILFAGPQTLYTSKDLAAQACAGNSHCDGISTKGSKFITVGSSKLIKKKGYVSWRKRGATTKYGGYYWIARKNYKAQQYNPTAYTALNVARKKCLSSASVS